MNDVRSKKERLSAAIDAVSEYTEKSIGSFARSANTISSLKSEPLVTLFSITPGLLVGDIAGAIYPSLGQYFLIAVCGAFSGSLGTLVYRHKNDTGTASVRSPSKSTASMSAVTHSQAGHLLPGVADQLQMSQTQGEADKLPSPKT